MPLYAKVRFSAWDRTYNSGDVVNPNDWHPEHRDSALQARIEGGFVEYRSAAQPQPAPAPPKSAVMDDGDEADPLSPEEIKRKAEAEAAMRLAAEEDAARHAEDEARLKKAQEDAAGKKTASNKAK